MHDSVVPPVWSLLPRQIFLNPVWRVGCEGLRSEPERSEVEAVSAAKATTAAHRAKLDSDKLGDEAETKPVARLNHALVA